MQTQFYTTTVIMPTPVIYCAITIVTGLAFMTILGPEELLMEFIVSGLPIYTIRLPGPRLYVVNSPSLISAVQRHVRTLSFSPFLARAASNLIAASKPGVEILSQDEENGFITRFHHFNHVSLSPGHNLDTVKRKAWKIMASLPACGSVNSPRRVRMYEWISNEVMMATTEAIYGSQNPFRKPAVRTAWSKYYSGMTHLMTGVMPSITARQSIHGREALVQAFAQYYGEGGLEDTEASPYIKDQYECFSQGGLKDPDIARTGSAFSIALLSNIMPATFWTLYHIFSDPAILQDCRKEISAALQRDDSENYSLDLASVELSCPILVSTYTEALRHHSTGISVRQALDDQLIGEYTLKKGAIVMIPAGTQHFNPSIWGETVNEFDHLRFLGTKGRLRSFGGGLTLCPGRHFATSTILGFAASSILNFDMQPWSGRWVTPIVKNSSMSNSINQPDVDIDVELRCRTGQTWRPTFSGTKRTIQVASEDANDPNAVFYNQTPRD
ncbi:hypothetical protein EKO27_g8181 [Xylaria grammica]|uniref:Cytochrome P450 n=1 Tax=Xylaria grammica TaxID=363999 RepID=A0A439CXH6_9PEZI|nr:hypothetical protein EKO27_g8181 [Xylaria grammica]